LTKEKKDVDREGGEKKGGGKRKGSPILRCAAFVLGVRGIGRKKREGDKVQRRGGKLKREAFALRPSPLYVRMNLLAETDVPERGEKGSRRGRGGRRRRRGESDRQIQTADSTSRTFPSR